jgi:hypothetical protein
MNESRLMIVMGERDWTQAVLHLVCAASRRSGAEVLLIKMAPVRHPLLLGAAVGLPDFPAEDVQVLEDLAATAEDYGVTVDVRVFQYANYWPGVVDAAAQLGATAVLAHIPSSPIPYWHDFRRWWLRRRLAGQQQLFLALDDLTPSLVWTPSVTLQNQMAQLLEKHPS